ncbi:hypothetical protein CDL12_08870 [Handroanthus impetiginosus]|uniref:Uncharacterized protein n=1 Tax=Handroanthus impetiginosus TaxID=429701 RepID=A0A2G9HMC7_9LAMI|nr:hypothetical protein CDL12_08870 [Handroanthus impetiginosus]
MCMEMLSNLGEVGEPAEELVGALGVAGLTLKLIMNRPAVMDFRKFSPEIEVLQSDIAKAIHLLDDSKRVSFIELKRLQSLLDPECMLSDRSLRMAVRNLLTEYLYECSDMDKVPDYLVAILDIINGRAQPPSCRKQSSSKIHSSAQELMGEVIQKEVEYILNVSGQAKEVVLDFLPEHEFDEDFARAYLEDVKGGDTVYISDKEDEDIDDEQVGDISQHYEFHSYNSCGQSESIDETIPADQSHLSTSDEDRCSSLLSPDSRLNIPLDSMHITETGSYEIPSYKEPKVLDDKCVTHKEYPSGCVDAYPDSFTFS